MALDQELFKQQMNLLADRIGRELAGPTQVEYWRQLERELTNEQFLAAMMLLIRTWKGEYRTWPSPQQIVEMIRPVAAPTLSAAEAFELVLDLTNKPDVPLNERRTNVQLLGAAPFRAFRAAGGLRDFANILEADIQWVRKRFIQAYQDACEHAESEQQMALALNDAEVRVQQLVSGLANSMQIGNAKPLKRVG